MKIVFASTPGQEEKIDELVSYIYSNVFPYYFSDKEIRNFERMRVLHISPSHYEYFGTLRDAFHVLTGLQTIISILESTSHKDYYELLFNKNALKLQEFNVHFPFEYGQFMNAKFINGSILSMYTKPANELLI